MLEIFDDINNTNLSPCAILLDFDVVNMFPCIDSSTGIPSVGKCLKKGNV